MPRLQQAALGGVWMVVNDCGMVPVDGMVCQSGPASFGS